MERSEISVNSLWVVKKLWNVECTCHGRHLHSGSPRVASSPYEIPFRDNVRPISTDHGNAHRLPAQNYRKSKVLLPTSPGSLYPYGGTPCNVFGGLTGGIKRIGRLKIWNDWNLLDWLDLFSLLPSQVLDSMENSFGFFLADPLTPRGIILA